MPKKSKLLDKMSLLNVLRLAERELQKLGSPAMALDIIRTAIIETERNEKQSETAGTLLRDALALLNEKPRYVAARSDETGTRSVDSYEVAVRITRFLKGN